MAETKHAYRGFVNRSLCAGGGMQWFDGSSWWLHFHLTGLGHPFLRPLYRYVNTLV